MTVRQLWKYTLIQVRLMAAPGVWDIIFAQCFPLPPEDGFFVLSTRSWYVQQRMEIRLHKLPEDVISTVIGRPVQVEAVLVDPQ